MGQVRKRVRNMVYYGTSVSNSACAPVSTGYSTQFSMCYVISDGFDGCQNLTRQEIDKLKKSMEMHKESLSLLGQ